MIISVYGAGYVGLVSAACLAALGHRIICVDINQSRVAALKRGECPIYEAQLPELLKKGLTSGRLLFTDKLNDAVHKAQVHIIATGTPPLSSGEADLSQVFDVAACIARDSYQETLLVIKSTVPPGTGYEIETRLQAIVAQRQTSHRIEVASNPEFLREGTAVEDFLQADRIIIGGSRWALTQLKMLYEPLMTQGIPVICMSRISAELSKYASNAMLACKISFVNQMACLAEKLGGNIDDIREGMSLDHRIGPHFLQAGIGYGGACFPKDTQALLHVAKTAGIDTALLEAIQAINETQQRWVMQRLNAHFHNQLKGRTIGLWGLSFKPGTDDVRQSSGLIILNRLIEAGACIRVYDPAAMESARSVCSDVSSIVWCETLEKTLAVSLDALVIATDWPVFKNYALSDLVSALKEAPLIDGRNCFRLTDVQQSGLVHYYSVGRPWIVNREVVHVSAG